MNEAMRRFGLQGRAQELSVGHVNRTYLITAPEGDRYILQRVNTAAFPQPHRVMENISAVTEHIQRRMAREGAAGGRRVLHYLRTQAGQPYYDSPEHGFWRAYRYVGQSVCYAQAPDLRCLEQAGGAFGRFQYWLSDLDAGGLWVTVPGFHDTPARLRELRRALDDDPLGRARRVRPEAGALLSREPSAGVLSQALARGEIPLRVSHNDTKLSNVLFDADTGEALCVIDLDTVMPGSALFDFGDGARSAACVPGGTPDRPRDRLDVSRYRAFAAGFLAGCGAILTPRERQLLPQSLRVITLELAARYLTDYLTGDRVFRTAQPEQNLYRARARLSLLLDAEEALRRGELEV